MAKDCGSPKPPIPKRETEEQARDHADPSRHSILSFKPRIAEKRGRPELRPIGPRSAHRPGTGRRGGKRQGERQNPQDGNPDDELVAEAVSHRPARDGFPPQTAAKEYERTVGATCTDTPNLSMR